MNTSAPLVDGRDDAAVLAELLASLPDYLPEWATPQDQSAASSALMRAFARNAATLIAGLNRVPDRSMLAFLDMLGISLLPAQGARAPIVFNLAENSPVDAALPANSQLSAPLRAPSPSLLTAGKNQSNPEPAVFATTQPISIARAHLAALYSLKPDTDEYADHTPFLSTGFTLFDHLQPVEHSLYLGHDRLLALAADAEIRVAFDLGSLNPASQPPTLRLAWEYLSQDGWLPLAVEADGDDTAGLTNDGLIVLHKRCGPDAKAETVAGRTSFWVRGRLLTPLPPLGRAGVGTLPVIDTVRLQVAFTKAGLQPDAAFTDQASLDTSNVFYPFGKQPALHTTFYLACKEAFQHATARIAIQVEMASWGAGDASLTWEYFNGKVWSPLGDEFDFQDGVQSFTGGAGLDVFGMLSGQAPVYATGAAIRFRCPADWGESTVNGVKNFWLRARVDHGDFGHPIQLDFSSNPPALHKSTLQPPAIARLTLEYSYETAPVAPDHCLGLNDFVFNDFTETCRWPHQTFQPFRPVDDWQPALHFGFNQPLPTGLISLYLQVPESSEDMVAPETLALVWEYHTVTGWRELSVLDETDSFRRAGMLQFIGPTDAAPVAGLGGDLYRLRARLKRGEALNPTPVNGIWLNAVWATNRTMVAAEPLGESNGNPHQVLHFRPQRAPIMEGEQIEVREWAGRGAEWESVIKNTSPEDVRFEYDPATQAVRSVWIRWHARPHLFASGPEDRHYIIERAAGSLRFGDSRHGRIPPAGARIIATYDSGGGLAGNVAQGAISELRAGVPYLASFTNPAPADGGAAAELLDAVRARGPQRLRHGDRAVAPQDYEWVAREASPAVARVRCLPVTGPAGRGQRGWVTLVIVPHGTEPQPQPTPELKRRVREHMAARVPVAVARHLRIWGPQYWPVSIMAEVVPSSLELAAQAEERLLMRLRAFLHPLTGGLNEQGWPFGQALYLSHVATIIETTQGVSFARQITLMVQGQVFDECIPVPVNAMIASGDHELRLTWGGD